MEHRLLATAATFPSRIRAQFTGWQPNLVYAHADLPAAPRFNTFPRRGHMNHIGTIFLLDDEPLCLGATQALLQTYGFECRTFTSGGELLESLPENATGLILADYRLMEQDGLEIFKRLRERGHELPFVLISGHAESDTRRIALNAGVAEFLLKPIAADDLRDALIRVLEAN